MEHRSSPRLWHEPGDDLSERKPAYRTTESLSDMMDRFASKQQRSRSLLFFLNNSMAVGQEFVLACLLLEWHRVELKYEDQSYPSILVDNEQRKQTASMVLVSVALVVILFHGEFRGGRIRKQRRSEKVRVRATDALLLAGILRLLSAVLRTLTASYSSDTVHALAIGGMVVHLFACDYSYANGRISRPATATSTRRRPVFLGGTLSLNAALFSTTLLASRLSSNTTVYVFISSSITLFAFYPETRHAIATQPHASFVSFVVTACLSLASLVLLDDVVERVVFVGVLIFVCLVAPCWKHGLQRYKRIINGPWDIAHVSMQDQESLSQSDELDEYGGKADQPRKEVRKKKNQ